MMSTARLRSRRFKVSLLFSAAMPRCRLSVAAFAADKFGGYCNDVDLRPEGEPSSRRKRRNRSFAGTECWSLGVWPGARPAARGYQQVLGILPGRGRDAWRDAPELLPRTAYAAG